MTIYRIESRGTDDSDPGHDNWSSDYCGDVVDYATYAEADAAIADLQSMGGEWAEATYRVREIDDENPYAGLEYRRHNGQCAYGEWRPVSCGPDGELSYEACEEIFCDDLESGETSGTVEVNGSHYAWRRA